MRHRKAGFALVGVVFTVLLQLSACSPESSSSSLGDAYVAPASLNLHSNLTAKSTTVAVLKHGDHLTVVDVRRRYVKVRSDKGAEGWLDSRQLLSKEEMAELRQDTAHEVLLPSQGRATAFDLLNLHIGPDRRSAAFAQIAAGAAVDVLAHRGVAKPVGPEPVATLPFMRGAAAAPAKRPRHQKVSKSFSLRPVEPPAPKPPANWQQLSAERIDGASHGGELNKTDDQAKGDQAKKAALANAKPVIMEDWSLIRTKDKTVGWVLSRNLYMSIPDDVAQYAEGQRISSYFDLGTVEDEEKGVKHDWLWTTLSRPEEFDFDRFRVFTWNRHRHRYETSYRQKDLTGFFPVTVEPAEANTEQRRFSIILRDDGGRYWKKRYSFDGTLVHLVSADPYEPAPGNGPTKAVTPETQPAASRQVQPNWLRKQLERIRSMLHR